MWIIHKNCLHYPNIVIIVVVIDNNNIIHNHLNFQLGTNEWEQDITTVHNITIAIIIHKRRIKKIKMIVSHCEHINIRNIVTYIHKYEIKKKKTKNKWKDAILKQEDINTPTEQRFQDQDYKMFLFSFCFDDLKLFCLPLLHLKSHLKTKWWLFCFKFPLHRYHHQLPSQAMDLGCWVVNVGEHKS